MARLKKADQEIRDATASLDIPEQVVVDEKVKPTFHAWIESEISQARLKRDELIPRWRKWASTISGVRPTPPVRQGASNISVPLTMWARVAVRARLSESAFQGGRRLLTVESVPGRRSVAGGSNATVATSLSKLLSAEILNRRGLAGKESVDKTISEIVDLGGGALKIYPELDTVRKVLVDGKPKIEPVSGKVRWEYISIKDLIYVDGYGTDTQMMPIVGHEFDLAWIEIKQRVKLGYYDSEVLQSIEGASVQPRGDRPALTSNAPDLKMHRVAEIYLDYDIDDDGILESIMIHWHIDACKPLGIWWNSIPDGRRPVIMSQFDIPADPTCAIGQGVCEKLEGPQDEVDAIHNIGIEAGKRGAAFVTVFKEGSRAEEDFGGDEDVSPGDKIVTEDPSADILTVPLGDARAGLSAIQLEEHTRMYVTRILGLDESRIGNVESGKRVAASVGMATMREGRMIIRSALTSLGEMLTEASYLTLDLWRVKLPSAAIAAALDDEESEALQGAVFSIQDASFRSQFIIRFNAQDAAASNEEKKQELLAVNQFLFGFYDRMQQITMMMSNPQLPPAAKKPMLLIVERMERGVEALLNTLDSIPNPEELMVHMGALKDLLERADDAVVQGSMIGDDEDMDEQSAFGDLGGGVV